MSEEASTFGHAQAHTKSLAGWMRPKGQQKKVCGDLVVLCRVAFLRALSKLWERSSVSVLR